MINWHTPWQKLFDCAPAPRGMQPGLRQINQSDWLSARAALEVARPMMEQVDPLARLCRVVAHGQVDQEGRASGWIFEFDAPGFRSTGEVHCRLDPARMQWVYATQQQPFPAPGSPEHRAQVSGWMSCRWVEACWKSHLDRAAVLPWDFEDSSLALTFLAGRGVATDAGLSSLVLENHEGSSQWDAVLSGHHFRIAAN